MKKPIFTLFTALLLSIFCSCGSSDGSEDFIEKFFHLVYEEKRPNILFSRMTETMQSEIRSRKLSIFSSKERLSEKYKSHSIESLQKIVHNGRIILRGLVKQFPKRGRASYRTFFAKFLKRTDKSGESSWVLYDLFIRNRRKPKTISYLTKLLTLSPRAQKIATSVTNKIEILIFDRRRDSITAHLAKEFISYNEKKIGLRFYNPMIDRGTAESYGITDPGYLVVEKGKTRYRIKFSELEFITTQANRKKRFYEGERILATAIKRVSSSHNGLLYITGHGERNHKGKKFPDLSNLYKTLQNFGFKTSTGRLRLSKTNTISTILFADPRYPLSVAEQKTFDSFLKKGGKAILLLEKPLPHTYQKLLKKLGITPLAHTIVDPYNKEFTKGPTWMETFVPKSIAGQNFFQRDKFRILIAEALGFIPTKGKKNPLIAINPVITTSSNGWAEASYDKDKPEEVGFTQGWDVKGPISLAYCVKIKKANKQTAGKLVIVGDSDFVSNQLFLTRNSNWLYFRELINWLNNEKAFAIKPRRLFNSVRRLF